MISLHSKFVSVAVVVVGISMMMIVDMAIPCHAWMGNPYATSRTTSTSTSISTSASTMAVAAKRRYSATTAAALVPGTTTSRRRPSSSSIFAIINPDHENLLDDNHNNNNNKLENMDEISSSCSSSSLSSSMFLLSRRKVFMDAAIFGLSSLAFASNADADDNNNESLFLFERNLDNNKISYQIQIPTTMKQTQKPVKTHLDEINFVSDTIKGYQYGITVDPVRINSLQEFGKPEEVAARVVTAEVNRDGIFEVTLLKDPYQSDDGAYILEYLSVGKRGNKHLINKIFISKNQMLYVLTAQVKQETFVDNIDNIQTELMTIVNSFQV